MVDIITPGPFSDDKFVTRETESNSRGALVAPAGGTRKAADNDFRCLRRLRLLR